MPLPDPKPVVLTARSGSLEALPPASDPTPLKRDLGLFGATMMGLGSIIGTGVFVSLGIAAGTAGPAVVLAIALAALVATCNALSSAQLAASHPVSGGTYEYGYRYLRPWLGFSAGWMFLCAKCASAATAALGFSGYLLNLLGADPGRALLTISAGATVLLTTVLVVTGIRLSSRVNIVIVSVTILTLLCFVAGGLPTAISRAEMHFMGVVRGTSGSFWPGLLEATAMMFVAYTGYGRIATLGEEVRKPRTTIPRAIVVTLWTSALLYLAVAVVAVAAIGPVALGTAARLEAAPLEVAAREFGIALLPPLVAIGAMTAMLGVLLNLLLGLSRVLLAMGRRGDMPSAVARVNASSATPRVAVVVVGVAVLGLTLIGSVRLTWSFSAFTVLIYYAITNLAALRLARGERLYPRVVPWAGLWACLFLTFWVDWQVWIAGVCLIAVGLMWHGLARRLHAGRRLSHGR